jgi:hypothetical protein
MLIDLFNKQENNNGNDQKIEHGVKKQTNVEGNGSGFLGGRQGIKLAARQGDESVT